MMQYAICDPAQASGGRDGAARSNIKRSRVSSPRAAGSGSAKNYHNGIAAEEAASALYAAAGAAILAARWRCPEGEIDLIVEMPEEIIFVEVKARRRHDAGAVTARQWARIGAAASRYLAEETDGTRGCRFDLVVVDGTGRIECIENARSFDEW